MLDPGTAIAVAGLAFDVAKDLLKLFKAWKSCPEDAIELRAAILWLSETFGLIKRNLRRLRSREQLTAKQQEEFDETVRGTEHCESRLDALKAEVDKVHIATRDTAYKKIKNELKRFRYCFSKDRIRRMLDNVQQCENNLHIALTSLNIGITVSVLDEVTSLTGTLETVGKNRDKKLAEEFESLKTFIREQAAQSVFRQQLALPLRDHEHKQALEWLMPLERQLASSSFHASLYRRRAFGTGSWFIGGAVFQNWQEDQNACLWVRGQVGCGKSVLCSTIIHDLQQRCRLRVDDRGGDVLIYHYFSHREGTNQQAEPMLRSCIAQAGFCGVAKALLVDFYNRHHISFLDVDPSLAEFAMFFFEVLKILSVPVHAAQSEGSTTVNVLQRQIYIVLDALDEIPFGSDRDEVLRFIQALRNRRLPNLHLLLTSRVGDEEHDIADMLDQAGEDREKAQENSGDVADNSSLHSVDTLVEQLPLVKYVAATEDIKADVELVVQKELRTQRRLKSLQQDLKERVLKSLVRDKQPVFRIVALQLTALEKTKFSSSTTVHDIDKILESRSADYDEIYQQLLDSVPTESSTMVHNALRWLVHARRQLSLAEFVEICAFGVDRDDKIKFWESHRRSPQDLAQTFAGFVGFQSSILALNTSVEISVSLDHLSVQEYLVGRQTGNPYSMEPCDAHQVIVQCCVRYLMQNNSLEKRRQQYALREYAWNYWTWHCVRTRPPDDTSAEIEDALTSKAAHTDDSNSGNELYLSSMLWALAGMQRQKAESRLSTSLALPYFYDELDIDSVTSLDLLDHRRLAYQHNTLDDPRKQLRLINLLPTNDDSSELRAKIEVIGSIKEKSYEVVTYMWNPTKQPRILRINGMPYDILAGLAHVLRRLRSNTKSAKVLWIDAVSIDQQQQDEKSIMVGRMPDIFRCATSHAIFADTTAKANDGIALKLIEHIDQILTAPTQSDDQKREDLRALVSNQRVEALLGSLFDRRIWTRLWPLQEMVLTKDSTVFYGEHQISIKVIERVLLQHSILEAVIRSVRKPTLSTSELSKDHIWQSIIEMACTRAAVQRGHGIQLLRALYASRYLQCHNPLDRIYGVFGLLQNEVAGPSLERDEPQELAWPVAIDYERDPAELFIDVGNHLLERYKNLDIFSFISHELSPSTYYNSAIIRNGLPSWVSTFTFGVRETWPLVTASITYPIVPDVFRACGEQYEVQEIRPMNEVEWHSRASRPKYLCLRGHVLDEIFQIYPEVKDATFIAIAAQRRAFFSNDEAVASCTGALHPNEILFSAYWRTVCANQIHLGKLIPSDMGSEHQRLLPENAAQESAWDTQETPLIALQFSENRSFFVTVKGRIGLSPATTQVSDQVAILPGGKVPYILRQRHDSQHLTHLGPAYTLIGDSYVHGIMHGEAMKDQDGNPCRSVVIV